MKYKSPYGSVDTNASYVDKDVPGAVSGSRVPRQAVEAPQRELHNLIVAAGLVPDHADLEQVGKAIQTGRLNYAVAGGSANALTVTLAPIPTALTVGMTVMLKIGVANTGPVTLNVNGLGAVPIGFFDGSAIPSGALVANRIVALIYDGATWIWAPALRAATQAETDAGQRGDVYVSPSTMKDKQVVLFKSTLSVATQSFPNDLQTAVNNLAASENTFLDSTFATSTITIGARDAGVWFVVGDVGFSIPGTGNVVNSEIWVNGARALVAVAASNASYTGFPATSGLLRLSAGDTVRLYAKQISGAAKTINTANFSGFRLGK